MVISPLIHFPFPGPEREANRELNKLPLQRAEFSSQNRFYQRRLKGNLSGIKVECEHVCSQQLIPSVGAY